MPKLTHRALQHTIEFLHNLYPLRSWDDLTTHIINAFPAIISTDTCAYNDLSRHRRRAVLRVWPSDHPNIPDSLEILGRYAHQSPLVSHIERTKDLTPHKITDFISQRQFRTTDIYNEFYRPLNLPYTMGTAIGLTRDSILAISFNRVKRDYTEEHLAILQILRPHLVQAFANAEAVTDMQNHLAALNRALEEVDRAVISVTPQGRIRWATPLASRLMTDYGLQDGHPSDWLPGELREWMTHQLEQLLAPSHLPTPIEPFMISRPDRALTIRLAQDGSQCLLMFEETITGFPVTALTPLGLSRRETEILAWVAQGKTNCEIGTIVGISPRTVQKHLERIYQKLGVDNRHAAITLAMETLRNHGRRNGFRP